MAGSIALALVLAAAGTAEAARRYDESRADTLLAGIVVGGVPVGGKTVEQAAVSVERFWEQPIDDELTLRVGSHAELLTWRELGASTNVRQQVAQAVEDQRKLSLFSRLWHRLTGRPYDRGYEVARTLDVDTARTKLTELARQTDVAPVNSQVDLSSGFIKLTQHRHGHALDVDAALESLQAGVASAPAVVRLPRKEVQPSVERSDYGTMLLVRVGENRLYHYRGGSLVKSYPVATGKPDYPTPTGRFQITLKRRNPTWVNPAKRPGAWGANLPARIGPGPSNPLGTRALNLNASGIRIHGTSAVGSIGYNASHGCIRMRMGDVEELFERVSVGTPVFVIRAGALKPLGSGDDGPRAEGG